jgi:hypothetical protein
MLNDIQLHDTIQTEYFCMALKCLAKHVKQGHFLLTITLTYVSRNINATENQIDTVNNLQNALLR